MQNKDIAILVVEFQKAWTEKSFFHKLIRKEYTTRKVFEKSKRLLDEARKENVPIIQSPFIIDKNNKESYKKIPFIPKILGQFKAHTWRVEYTDGIFDKQHDIEVKGRTAFDNTIDSNLVEILKRLEIKKVYIMGFTTDHCVAETIDALVKLGYEVVLIKDATATFSRKNQGKMENRYTTIDSVDLMALFH